MKKRGLVVPFVIIAVAGAIALTVAIFKKEPAAAWRTAEVRRGSLAVEVTATGAISPRTTVQVGTQVSGTVSKLFADFNSHVEKGQVIAKLDTTPLAAAVEDARASIMRASAQATLSAQNCKRTRLLFDKGLVAAAELDQAIADSQVSAATLSSAKAQLERAKINLTYATIVSPINGTVINRAVDVGQTVAASFNTPTLFSIADDLTRMQVQASIDEADIGEIRDGQKATFTVDAYPERTFTGRVTTIRLQPTVTQNVVTYTVIIDVTNEDLALLPGMTANITIAVRSAENVLIVPSSALRFQPPLPTGKPGGARAARARGTPASDRPGFDTAAGAKKRGSGDRVFVLADGELKRVKVMPGLTNGESTAVEGDLAPGQQVVVGIVTNNKTKAAQQPFGMGMRRRF
ncbi:MAG: efflux RND transporter periplasmic adaptor subunit [Chitinispirillaceae bacterium]|nr:efflux RND transporter periplasmic adaptor subunit [Chitinispirillaceae bacterium]